MVETFFCSLLLSLNSIIISLSGEQQSLFLNRVQIYKAFFFWQVVLKKYFRLILLYLQPHKQKHMYNKNIKLFITALLVATAVWQFTEGGIGNGIFLILLSLIFVLLYFKNEFIILAFLKLRKQDFPGAQKWLSYIKNPQSALVRKQQGYYEYLHGLMLSQTNITAAEKHFKKAIELGLSMDTDLAIAKLNLAGVAMTRRRKLEATNLLAEAKKLDKQGLLKDQIKMMKEQMKKI